MPRILHIAASFPSSDNSSVNPWLVALIQAQRALGHDVQVLTPSVNGLGDGPVKGIPVHRFRYAPARIENLAGEVAIYERLRKAPWRYLQLPAFFAAGWWKARQLRHLEPDIVHVHWPVPMVLLALPFSGSRLVCHYHQTELSLLQKMPWLKALFIPRLKRAALHLCNSTYTRERLEELTGIAHAQVVPMPYAWAVPKVLPAKEAGRILFVGRMVFWKGGDILMEACAQLKKEGLSFKVIMVGDGPERRQWEQQAATAGLEVDFSGWKVREDLMREYARATVVVMPSRFDPRVWVESLGVVLLEAMACGTAVIASRKGGPLDIVRDGANGFFFVPMQAADLAEKLKQILRDPALAKRLGAQGQQDAAAFAPDTIAVGLDRLYRSLSSH